MTTNDIPFIGYTLDTLARLPHLHPGDLIDCPACDERHLVDGERRLLWYRCGGEQYLAGVDGRCVIGVRALVRRRGPACRLSSRSS